MVSDYVIKDAVEENYERMINMNYYEWLIFLAWQHMSHRNIVRSSEIQMFFWNIKIGSKIGGQK